MGGEVTGFFRILIFLFTISVSMGAAQAERRVALVIGNSGYQHVAALKNPYNDARGMVAKLQSLDFDVVEGLDLDLRGLRSKIEAFVSKLNDADIALFFYAGHGLQVNGVNYLLPTDAQLNSPLDLEFETVPINLILRTMEQASKTNLVFLDACRNNPLAENLARSMGTRSASVGRGLAKTSSGIGTLISFATQPGNVALDGAGENSPFTTALLKHLGTPGQDITRDLVSVRRDVLEATNGRQVPWENSSLTGEIILKAKEPPKPVIVEQPVPPAKNPQIELAYWESIKTGENAVYFENYLKRYPDGQFADIAKVRIDEIKDRATAREAEERRRVAATEIAYWQSIQNASQPELFESYLTRYPDGDYADLARLKIDLLKREKPVNPKAPETSQIKADEEPQKDTETQKEIVVANLSPESAGAAATDEQPAVVLGEKELARALQTELNRLGCSVGRVDGAWGKRSRGALRTYAAEAGLELASLDPKVEILDQLKKSTGRVCPLTCGRNQELKSGKCVAVRQPASTSGSSGTSKTKTEKTTTSRTSSACPSDPNVDSHTYAKRRRPGTDMKYYTHSCGRTVVCRAHASQPRVCFWQ